MKEQIKTPEKELSDEEIANLFDEDFKILIIRMLKELSKYGNKIKKTQEEMKVTLSEIKINLQGTNSERKETGTNQRFRTEGRKHSTETERRK